MAARTHTFRGLGKNGVLRFGTRIARMFAYGFLSVVLVLYLAQAGLKETQIGLLLTLTLAGDTASCTTCFCIAAFGSCGRPRRRQARPQTSPDVAQAFEPVCGTGWGEL
jgi:hypothetical protein